MNKTFSQLDELLAAVKADKEIEGSGSYVANRYPVRFVLFDNFRDCYDFVNAIADKVQVMRIHKWMDLTYPDVMLTHSKLSTFIQHNYQESLTKEDILVAPFSELARFYDNKMNVEFNTLISDLKFENDKEGYVKHRRLYIPIVGLAGKMSKFFEDSQSIMWYLQSGNQQLNYRLVLTDGTNYGVNGLQSKYTVVENVTQWVQAWSNQELTNIIICTSPSIYANAEFAQPDNAFTFCPCKNAYEFLINGLGVNLRFIPYKESDNDNWEKLAREIDINDFNFEQFFNHKYDIHELANYEVFIKTWFEFNNQYYRWLLSAYYAHKFCNSGYICQVLQSLKGYTNPFFVEELALKIFDLENAEDCLDERNTALSAAATNSVVISQEARDLLKSKLQGIADTYGYVTAMKYLTIATDVEKELLIKWLGERKIELDDIKTIYPELFAYMQTGVAQSDAAVNWLNQYISDYKFAKLSNCYTDAVKATISQINKDSVAFENWYQEYRTTRTLLSGREDIEVFYWIDGLGIDWIPFIQSIVEKRAEDNFFLNEVLIGKSVLPTKTSTNKEDLLKLCNGTLPKVGDIDKIAHHCRIYPGYLIDDMKIVEEAIDHILKVNPGRKIAIISDHGMSFMPQLCNGLNLAGFTSDHGGRLAKKNSGKAVSSENYTILPDEQTVCALRHESLCGKIPAGSGSHGGCSPEEVLVPIFIISDQKNAKSWTAVLLSPEVTAGNPKVRFNIRGISGDATPIVIYNGNRYALTKDYATSEYVSTSLKLDANATDVTVQIGLEQQQFRIKVNLGFEEENLFDE